MDDTTWIVAINCGIIWKRGKTNPYMTLMLQVLIFAFLKILWKSKVLKVK